MGSYGILTPRAKSVVEVHARDEATRLGADFVGTEHVLLGLLAEGDGLAAKLLKRHGLTLNSLRREVAEELGASFCPRCGSIMPKHADRR